MALSEALRKISDFSSLVPKKKNHKQVRNKIKEQVRGLIKLQEIQV